MSASTTSTMATSQVSERKAGGHSREASREKYTFPRTGVPTISVSRSHSRNSSWDSKKNDDIMLPQRRTPPSIQILPASSPSTRRNSNEYGGNSFSTVPISYSHPTSPTYGPLTWATEKLTRSSQTASKKLLNTIGLSKLSTSFSSYDTESQIPRNWGTSNTSFSEKAMQSGQFPSHYYPKPTKYHSTFRSAPIGYTIFHLKRYSQLLFTPRRLLSLLVSLLLLSFLFRKPLTNFYRSSPLFGGGSKFVIILASNQGGGVLGWKGEKEWFVERESIKNKKLYAEKHGYTLEIRDMKAMRRYAHEWREGWEKIDVLKQTMKKYPKAEWFWFLDIQTYIMEPEISLQRHIFSRLNKVTYRDINKYNPLNITHPVRRKWLDNVAKSVTGDADEDSIGLILPQDCGGFNLGSFFARRSEFTERLMDVWWDPVGYEQMHMNWEHKEQNVLEHLYKHQPWTRNSIAFIPQRMVNSFPHGACKEKSGDKNIFYQAEDRDFLVNMAGCQWGRDCAGEMQHYKEISEKLASKKGAW
ncbi:alpha-1,6-mannosyltransferase [Orbilia oligospora]|uniref:Alpha-1,6-mannosyltransferase n=1 Tax=Orbilia oligospora TaxID=2813651 RepID=A0A7C8KNA4_ORBOL|nr:alpha-1,6-mannosyltransferase [Orbilia oligospora]